MNSPGDRSRPVEAAALWKAWKTLRKKRSSFSIPSHRARKAPPTTLCPAPPTALGPSRKLPRGPTTGAEHAGEEQQGVNAKTAEAGLAETCFAGPDLALNHCATV
jgi:hypothetical protein